MPTRQELKEQSKKLVDGKIGVTFLPLLIYALISVAISSIFGAISPWVVWVGALLSMVVSYGFFVWEFNYIRKGETELVGMFTPMKELEKLISYFGASALSTLLILLGSIVIVPGVILTYAYAMVPFLMSDPENTSKRGIIDSLKLSRDMMKGHKWELFVLEISFIGWELLIALTFGILSIWKGQYINFTIFLYYENLKKEYELNHPGTFPELEIKQESDGEVVDAEPVDAEPVDKVEDVFTKE